LEKPEEDFKISRVVDGVFIYFGPDEGNEGCKEKENFKAVPELLKEDGSEKEDFDTDFNKENNDKDIIRPFEKLGPAFRHSVIVEHEDD
jgi:hypothetical protein